jgi:hypothetical protein
VVAPNQSLVRANKGKLLKQIDSQNELWYVNTADGKKYYISGAPNTLDVIKLFASGISNADLNKIAVGISPNMSGPDADADNLPDIFEEALGLSPVNADTDGDSYTDKQELDNGYNPNGAGRPQLDKTFAEQQKGRFFLQVEGAGQIWYVSPSDGKRYFVPSESMNAYNVLSSLSEDIGNGQLRQLPVGQEFAGIDTSIYAGCFVPSPTVLGATTNLPRTGFPFDFAQLVILPSLAAYPWLRRRYANALANYFSKLKV